LSNTHPSFEPEDNAILNQLVVEGPDPGSNADGVEQQTPDPTPEPTPAPQEPPATPEPTPAPASQDGGNVKAALRASRHQEKRLREQNATLQAELEALRAGKTPEESSELSTQELDDLKRDFPAQFKVWQETQVLKQQLQQQAPPPPPSEFQPRLAPPEVQVLIDEVPQLVQWQHDPAAQDKFDKAIEYDEALRHDPDWKGRTVVERFNEAARRAAAATGSSASPSPAAPAASRIDPAAAIASAPSIGPKGISDFPGGAPGNAPKLDYTRMSDQDILASLPVSD